MTEKCICDGRDVFKCVAAGRDCAVAHMVGKSTYEPDWKKPPQPKKPKKGKK